MSRRVMADGEIVSVSLRDMVPSVLFAGRGIPPSQLTERAVTLRYQARIDRPIVAARSCEELGPDWDRCASASRKEWGKTPPERGFLRGARPDSNRRPLGPQPGGTGAAHVPSRSPEPLGASELLLVSLKLDPRLDPGSSKARVIRSRSRRSSGASPRTPAGLRSPPTRPTPAGFASARVAG